MRAAIVVQQMKDEKFRVSRDLAPKQRNTIPRQPGGRLGSGLEIDGRARSPCPNLGRRDRAIIEYGAQPYVSARDIALKARLQVTVFLIWAMRSILIGRRDKTRDVVRHKQELDAHSARINSDRRLRAIRQRRRASRFGRHRLCFCISRDLLPARR